MALDYRPESVRKPTIDLALVPGRLFAADVLSQDGASTRASINFGTSASIAAHRGLAAQEQPRALELFTPGQRGDELLAVFSHEARSALAAIRNAAHVLRMQRAENSVALRTGMLIERQVGRMTRLIDDLTDITRARSAELSLNCERVDLCVVVQRAVDTLELDISARRHRLSVSLPPAPLWLQADAGRLEQVVVNLLGNAAKYTDPGGNVCVSLHQSGGQAIVCVRDSGIGIAAEVLPRVFDLYMQAAPASRRSEAGLGIGLALVRSLVELHGGRVSAASMGLGYGSVFTVCLPVAPE
jgi:signal transduction histidine kinase